MRSRELGKPPVDTSTWLTANQVSDMLNVAHVTIKEWERKGRLHAVMARRQMSNGASREVRVFDPHEIAGIPRRRAVQVLNDPGEIAARAFELFDQGKSNREIVMALREPPDKVQELHEQWFNLGGSEVVLGVVATEEIVRLVGPFDGVVGLVERLRETVALVEQLRRTCGTLARRDAAGLAVALAATRWAQVEETEEGPYPGVPRCPIRDRVWLDAMGSLRRAIAGYREATAGDGGRDDGRDRERDVDDATKADAASAASMVV